MKLSEMIAADAELLTWARGSIRYNTGRENQAVDFMAKLKHHNSPLATMSKSSVKTALTEIEKADRA